jgi:hypothetical protein
VVLDLCAGSGAWSEPYRRAGYEVLRIDLQSGDDVRLLRFPGVVHGILAAPPCTHLARSGARWWDIKGTLPLLDALSVVDACLRVVAVCKPAWWALENPEGRLRSYLGPPAYSFHPCDYGDPWTKKTLLWGEFKMPVQKPVAPAVVNWAETVNGKDRSRRRAVTPPGFAQAFFEANP